MKRTLLALIFVALASAAYAQMMLLGVGGNGGVNILGNLLQEGGAGAILQENSSKIQVQQ